MTQTLRLRVLKSKYLSIFPNKKEAANSGFFFIKEFIQYKLLSLSESFTNSIRLNTIVLYFVVCCI